MTIPDSRCVVDLYDDIDRGTRLGAERAWRWVIAHINDDEAAKEQIEHHMRNCVHCLLGFAKYLGGVVCGMAIREAGKENALAVATFCLDEVLNAPYLLDDPPDAPPG